MTAEISELTSLQRGNLQLAGGMSVCTYLFPPLLKRYRELHPNIELRISTGMTDEILRMLRGNEIDLALLTLPYDEPGSLVKLNHVPLDLEPGGGYVSCPDFVEIRDRCDFFENLAVYYDYREEGFELTGGERPVRVLSMPVGADYFSTLRIRPCGGGISPCSHVFQHEPGRSRVRSHGRADVPGRSAACDLRDRRPDEAHRLL